MERRGENGKMPVNPATDREAGKARRRWMWGGEGLSFSAWLDSFYNYPPRPPGGAKEGHAQRGYLVVTSCRPAYGDGRMRPPVPKTKLLLEQAGSEQTGSARGKGGNV